MELKSGKKVSIVWLIVISLFFPTCAISCIDKTGGGNIESGGKVAFEQQKAVDTRGFLGKDELLRSVSQDYWEALGLARTEEKERASEGQARGIVVPHHATAAALTANLVGWMAESKPNTVIILAPNHRNTGSAATTALCDFICHGKRVSADSAVINRLKAAGLVHVNDEPFMEEHSVGMLMPIIAWYLPDAKVVPVIFHHGHGVQEILAILSELEPEVCRGACVVASIDFSHYLTREEAEGKDREMLGYLLNGDAEAISRLDSSYIDSPTIMAAMLLYFGAEDMEVVANTNSGALLGNSVMPCTSYFAVRFWPTKN